MLTELILKNFKCFKEETRIPLSKMNIFTGANGSGKSSAIQALLLLAQGDEFINVYSEVPGRCIALNGKYINLGQVSEIKNKHTNEDECIKLGFSTTFTDKKLIASAILGFDSISENNNKYISFRELTLIFPSESRMLFEFGRFSNGALNEHTEFYKIFSSEIDFNNYKGEKFYLDANKATLIIDDATNTYTTSIYKNNELILNHKINPEDSQKRRFDFDYFKNLKVSSNNEHSRYFAFPDSLPPYNFRFLQYLSATRIGPQEYYLKKKYSAEDFEYQDPTNAIEHLLSFGHYEISNEYLIRPNIPNTLLDHIKEWLSYIFDIDNIQIDLLQTRSIIEMEIDDCNPTMTGFGYSYILPILFAGLNPSIYDAPIIIENPELHLTPKSQSRLMEFLCKIAESGVQVFLETHSDHIVNGARVMARKHYNSKQTDVETESRIGLSHEDISIVWFEKDKETRDTTVQKVELQPTGKLSHAPKGFFDQMNNDMRTILGFPE